VTFPIRTAPHVPTATPNACHASTRVRNSENISPSTSSLSGAAPRASPVAPPPRRRLERIVQESEKNRPPSVFGPALSAASRPMERSSGATRARNSKKVAPSRQPAVRCSNSGNVRLECVRVPAGSSASKSPHTGPRGDQLSGNSEIFGLLWTVHQLRSADAHGRKKSEKFCPRTHFPFRASLRQYRCRWRFRETIQLFSECYSSCYSSISAFGAFDGICRRLESFPDQTAIAAHCWNDWEKLESEWRGPRGSNPGPPT
jgi:hypothetical protein